MLENNRCKGHPDNKPLICKQLTKETAKGEHPGFVVTDNCLFRYKDIETPGVEQHAKNIQRETDGTTEA
jgi:hypothetical protein